MSSLFSIGDDELDLLDDEDFLLEACEIASSNLSTNLKGKIDRIYVGNCTKSITRQQDVGTTSSCESGLRKPLESLCDNATDGRVGDRKSTFAISGNSSLGARAKFITDQNKTLNSKPDNLSDLPRVSSSSDRYCMSPPSKRLAVETVASLAYNGNVCASSFSTFKKGCQEIGSKSQDVGPYSGPRGNNPGLQRSCSLQTKKQDSINCTQKLPQNPTWLQETDDGLSGCNRSAISKYNNCDLKYGFSSDEKQDVSTAAKELCFPGNSSSKHGSQTHGRIEKRAVQQSTCNTAINRNIPNQSSVMYSTSKSTIVARQCKANNSATVLKDIVGFQTPKENSSVTRIPKVQHQGVGDSTPLKTPRSMPRTRRFPGPAGLLPKLSPNQDLGKLASPQPVVRSSPAVQKKALAPTPNEDEDFIRDPWVTMVTEFNQGVPSSMRYTVIQALTKAALHQLHRGKVPSLCVLVKAFLPTDTDASILLKDPTGEIHGTVHRKVLEEYPSELGPGTGLVLRQVSVFSPCPRRHYLNITPGNIVEFYPADPTAVASSQPLATQFTQSGSTNDVQSISVGDEDTKETDERGTKCSEVEELTLDALDDQMLLDAADDELLVEASQSAANPSSTDHEWQEECYDDLLEGLENEDDLLDEALLV